MKACRYDIRRKDFEQAGAATADLKARLKRVGVEPDALRRAAIAAYEAAMNVVIHAEKGTMRVEVAPGVLRIVLEDTGPGIADVDKALEPGYSTAPDFARQMGFGAGLGLPNMKRHSDRFDIRSEVGRGTRVDMEVLFQSPLAAGADRHSIRFEPGRCRKCLACVRGCPTAALRVWKNGPELLDHLCVDCGRCIALCTEKAIVADAPDDLPDAAKSKPLLVPPALFGQFGAAAGPERILAALESLGFAPVHCTSAWYRALRGAALDSAEDLPRPAISPECPAVVNLIELRFPSLIGHVAPYASPVEAAAEALGGATVAAACPAQCTAVARLFGEGGGSVVSLGELAKAVRDALPGGGGEGGKPSDCAQPCEEQEGDVLEVRGMAHVMATLDEIETGLLADVRAVALYACDGGCFGTPLAQEEPAVARYRWRRMSEAEPALRCTGPLGAGGAASGVQAAAMPRRTPLAPREGVRLHKDMAEAIALLGEIDRLVPTLPGRDCALCGAPTCAAFAEDVVLGRVPAVGGGCPVGGIRKS